MVRARAAICRWWPFIENPGLATFAAPQRLVKDIALTPAGENGLFESGESQVLGQGAIRLSHCNLILGTADLFNLQAMRLRLYHHSDGARIAYREAGSGQTLVLLHSALLSHREFAPIVSDLQDRFRIVLPDLPLHGDSEDRSTYPYTLDWLVELIADFIQDVCGPSGVVGGHEVGAQIVMRALQAERINPRKVILMSSPLHRRSGRPNAQLALRTALRFGRVPGVDNSLSYLAPLVFSPKRGQNLSAERQKSARDLFRHAFADVRGNRERIRSWSKAFHNWPKGPMSELLDLYETVPAPVLLLWADSDRAHPISTANEALDLLPNGLLRVLDGTGFLMAYDDPVGAAREIAAFSV